MEKLTINVMMLAVVGFLVLSMPGGLAANPAGDAEKLRRELDEQVPRWQEQFHVPGAAIALIQNGRTAALLTYGFADKKNHEPVTPSTLFQVGSISKSLTAWGVMRLASEQKLSLDEPVGTYLQRWKLPVSPFDDREVTIRRLLSHTAGLPAHGGYLGTAGGGELPSLEQSLSGAGLNNPPLVLVNPPGKAAVYSGGGYTLLQLVVEEVTGQAFADYMDSQILRPLGMEASSFKPSARTGMSKAYGYFGQPLPDYRFTEQAAAGLRTNLSDLTAFVLENMKSRGTGTGQALQDGAFRSLLKEFQTPVSGEFALGMFVRELPGQSPMIYHSGDNRGWHAFYGFIPESNDGLVILTNADGGVELRQEVYSAWVKHQTGAAPHTAELLAAERGRNQWIAVLLGGTVTVYVARFVYLLARGRRAFICNLTEMGKILLSLRAAVLLTLGAGLGYAAYTSLLGLSAGLHRIVLIVLLWLLVLFTATFFPKQSAAGPSVISRPNLSSD